MSRPESARPREYDFTTQSRTKKKIKWSISLVGTCPVNGQSCAKLLSSR